MIIDILENSEKYEYLNKYFKTGFDYLKTIDKNKLPDSKVLLAEENLFALFFNGVGAGSENVKLEAHKKYIDIHFIVSGSDSMAYKNTSECGKIHTPFNETDDYMLFKDVPATTVTLHKNYFAIVFPEDAHAPLIGNENVCKIILKVRA